MRRSKPTRREFLQATATTAAAATLLPAASGFTQRAAGDRPLAYPENGVLIPDDGWRLWVDEQAEWKNDGLYLPEDVTLTPDGPQCAGKRLPINAPSGGWEALDHSAGIEVTLPGTVEQHFWGKFGQRPYTPDEYRYAADDPIPQNGAYFGVSWWYREIDIPASMQGKRIFLHLRGAHLRAEVYVNRKLVGYSIMEELPFECDLTRAAEPGGLNIVAIRITNPFGRFDWVDGLNAQWGAVKLYRSHGFGGLDRGMTISEHKGVRIRDAWVLNEADPKAVTAHIDVASTQEDPLASILCAVRDPSDPHLRGPSSRTVSGGDLLQGGSVERKGAAGRRPPSHVTAGNGVSTVRMRFAEAELWDLKSAKLYYLDITVQTAGGKTDTRTIAFGFRSFAVEGLGSNALFRLNGRRIKIYTAISWGYWGLNGMFPTPELAEKEVTQAQKLNLNCLNFHRNLAKEDVLRAHDRLGVLRYMEPGAGKMAIGKLPAGAQANAPSIIMQKPTDPADKFAQRYMFTKCVEMVKAFRSHPSVIEYCLQNEIGADLNNPDTLAILAAMRAEDPSRCIVLNDGFVAPPRKAAQAWYEPWSDHVHRSDQEPWGGWWNQHQGAGDQWYDNFYKSPTEFTYKSPVRAQISEFGEMEGCAVPDNHSLMLHQYASPATTGIGRQPANQSYDLADHREILAATDKFLDRWGFRKAFPATEHLWLSIGKKCYDTWQNYMENARISDELDFCAISGWESTSIENHSGIVDNLRNFKSDPAPIAQTLQPIHPVAKQRALCVALGQPATFDLYLLNDTPQAVTGELIFSAVTPSRKLLKLATLPCPTQTADQFSYLLKESFTTPPLTEQGLYQFKFSLSSTPLTSQTKEIWVTGTPMVKRARRLEVAVSGITPALRRQLRELGESFGLALADFTPGGKYDVIVSSGLTAATSATQQSGDTTGLEAQPSGTAKMPPARTGRLADCIVEAVKAGTPLLAIPQTDVLSDGVARQLAATGAFAYSGVVGPTRAPWMGNWYFVREHPVYAGLPTNQALGIHYQAKGGQSNGLLIEAPPGGAEIEIIAGYSRDHDRNIGAGTFSARLGSAKVLYQRVPDFHPVLQQRFLANALGWLCA